MVRYDAACKALAAAKSVDEAKTIRDVSEAMRAYAKQAKNKQLEVDAAEIRIRAERRIGELMQAQRETVGLAKPFAGKAGPGRGNTGPKPTQVSDLPTLAEAGIDKHLADRARKYAAVPEGEWNRELSEWRERVSSEHTRVITRLEKRGESEMRRQECDIPDSAIVSSEYTCPTCGQQWPEGKAIHG